MSEAADRRRVAVIGVGAGGPGHLTVEAAEALGRLDVVVALSKGPGRDQLLERRRRLLEAHGAPHLQVVEVADPPRATDGPYAADVAAWHDERARRLGAALAAADAGARIGILVWGDPSLYDSTLRLLERVDAGGPVRLDVEVLPGISSIQLLAAAHRIVVHRVGGSFLVTTGRRVAAGDADEADDVVVLLDAHAGFRRFVGRGYDLYWGAYLGDEHQVLRAGPVDGLADEVEALRAALRARHGWIFDLYLLRRRR